MSPSLDQFTQAVVERIMAQAELKVPSTPTNSTSLHEETQAVQSNRSRCDTTHGPMPEEPWYDPEDEAEVPLIDQAFRAYAEEHSY